MQIRKSVITQKIDNNDTVIIMANPGENLIINAPIKCNILILVSDNAIILTHNAIIETRSDYIFNCEDVLRLDGARVRGAKDSDISMPELHLFANYRQVLFNQLIAKGNDFFVAKGTSESDEAPEQRARTALRR